MANRNTEEATQNAVTFRGVTVRVYQCGAGTARPFHKFSFVLNGKRTSAVRRGLSDEAARAEAMRITEQVAGKDRDVLELTAEDVHAYRQALGLLGPIGKPLVMAASEYAGAMQLLGSHPVGLEAVVRFWLERNATVVPRNFGEAMQEFLREKEQDLHTQKKEGERGKDHHLAFLKVALGGWRADFTGPLHELTGQQIDAWLRTQQEDNDWENLTRNHYRAALSNFTNWAKTKNYLSVSWDELAKVPVAKTVNEEVLVFGPKEAKVIMMNAENYYPQYAAHLAIGFFAGVRSAEIQRMTWGDIYWDEGVIFVGRGKVNAQQRRVPLLPNCRAWLERYRGDDDQYICNTKDVSHGIMRVAESAGVEWVPNGPRHSFISYRRVVLGGNLHQLTDEAGNSPAVIKRHYSRPVPAKDADAFFAITPRQSKINPLPVAV